MTGTSPGVLPFYYIDNKYFKPDHKLIKVLQKMYNERVDESIRNFK
jgi:hypothetical protein